MTLLFERCRWLGNRRWQLADAVPLFSDLTRTARPQGLLISNTRQAWPFFFLFGGPKTVL